MKKISRSEFLCASAASVVGCGLMGGAQGAEGLRGPEIVKLGTIDVDVVETTPVVFKGKVYRFEYVRKWYWNNVTGDSYFRFVDHESGRNSPSFAHGYHLGSAMVDGDRVVVTGTNIWNGERVDVFVSGDMKRWEKRAALDLPGYGIFNTSMCKAGGQYVLMFEVGKPAEIAGARFTARFATSADLKTWTLTPDEYVYDKSRYSAPHCLRYLDGYYYNFFLASVGGGYEQHVARSRNLMDWKLSPVNPILKASDVDKVVVNNRLTDEHREYIAGAENRNNSDFDFCEYEGNLIINYSWGDQRGKEFLAGATYQGTEAEFLRECFPA